MLTIRGFTVAAALLTTTTFVPGCYAEADVPPPAVAVTTTTSADVEETDGYAPAYYDGYVVYYDSVGHPFYYGNGGAVVWVAPSSPHYVGLVNHWHVYGHAYPAWYAHRGYRYHAYRGNAGYHAYHGHANFRSGHGAPAHRR